MIDGQNVSDQPVKNYLTYHFLFQNDVIYEYLYINKKINNEYEIQSFPF